MKHLNYFAVIAFIGLSIGFSSCKTGMNTSESVPKENAPDIIPATWVAAIVVSQKDKETPCDFLLQLEDKTLLEPGELPDQFKSDKLMVWIEYLPSRRMSLCDKAMPITLSEIQKRTK